MKTVLHYYHFDCREEDQMKAYKALRKQLEGQGLKLFDGYSREGYAFMQEKIRPLDGQEIELDTDFLFNNQWNTKGQGEESGLRVFDWSEEIVNNRNLKYGMWLEQTEEMRDIRANTYACKFCGTHYLNPEFPYCNKCLGHELLTEEDLPLLELRPISSQNRKGIVTPDLLAQYHKVQRKARTKRLEEERISKLKALDEKKAALEIEHDAFLWLINHDCNYDNVIYYDHLKSFNFGWRKKLNDEQKAKLLERLVGFPYEYTINK